MSKLEETLLEYQKILKTLDLKKRENEKYTSKFTNEECLSVLSQTIENKYKLLKSYDMEDKIYVNLSIDGINVNIVFNDDFNKWNCNFSKGNNIYRYNDNFINNQHFLDTISKELPAKFFSEIELSLDDAIENEINKQIKIKSNEIIKLAKENDFCERVSKARKPNSKISVKGIDYKIGDTIFVVGKGSEAISKFIIDDFGVNNIGHSEAIEHIGSLNSYVDLEFFHNQVFKNFDNAVVCLNLLKLEQKFKNDNDGFLEAEDIEVLNKVVLKLKCMIKNNDINNKTISVDELENYFKHYITLNFDELNKENEDLEY